MVANSSDINKAARRFLKNGRITPHSIGGICHACDQLVRAELQRSVKNALKLGRDFVERTTELDRTCQAIAFRSFGWVQLVAGQYGDSEQSYLSARKLLTRDKLSRARIDRVLIDIYMYLDNYKAAERHGRMALKTFELTKAREDLAKTRVNLANLLHRRDQHREANQLYRTAGRYFQRTKNKFATALCWYNQANTEVQLFDFDKADRLFREAREIFVELEQPLYATGCLYGLAWMHMLRGDFHIALNELTECEAFYTERNLPRELMLCQLDRAESFLGLNLFSEARDAAEKASRSAEKLKVSYESAKAALFSGKANLALGNKRRATQRLTEAENGFRKAGNIPFRAATMLAQAQLSRSNGAYKKIIKAAGRLFQDAQLPLWEAVCDLQLMEQLENDEPARKRLASNRAAQLVPHLAARKYTLFGDCEASRHHRPAAIKYWSKAADLLDAVRAKLPPLEMRSSYFHHRSEPHQRLIAAEYKKNPLSAAVWSERFKTAGKWSPPDDAAFEVERQRVDSSLSALAGHVSSLSGMIKNPTGRRSSRGQLVAQFERLQQRAGNELARLEARGYREQYEDDIARLITKVSRLHTIVQFHSGADDLIVFVHHKGETRSHCYPDGVKIVNEFISRWRFLVECAPADFAKPRMADLREEAQLLKRIGDWLLPPLELPALSPSLLIIPEGRLASLPWQALALNGRPLVEDRSVLYSPSLRHHCYCSATKSRSHRSRILVGDTAGLNHVTAEIDSVRSTLADETLEIHNPWQRDSLPMRANENIWHYTGHAEYRADNPYYSSLLLKEGRIFAADFRFRRNRVNLVTLAACRTGQQTSLPGEESQGLVRTLLEMGARNVVASGWAVSDSSTSEWMQNLYTRVLQGSPVQEAVREASARVREKYPSAYHWAAFGVFGAG